MLLAFDVGNTNIVLGVYDGDRLVENWRMETDKNKSADEYGMIINQLFAYAGLSTKDVDDVIIATVVPSILYTLQHLSQKYFHSKAIVVGPGIKTGLIVKYDNPKQLGADRIVNVVGAYEQYGGPLIVIDIGTATTFDVVDENGDFLGGVISTGLGTSAEGLFQKAAKLPRIELVTPKNVICRNTITGMQAGIIFGFVGQIDEKRRTAHAGRDGCETREDARDPRVARALADAQVKGLHRAEREEHDGADEDLAETCHRDDTGDDAVNHSR